MAAIRPAKITVSVMQGTPSAFDPSFTVLAIVLATPWSLKIKNATKLKMPLMQQPEMV